MSRRCWAGCGPCENRAGLTLVEVVCGLALAATLLVSLVLAHAAHALQIHQAQSRLEAITALQHVGELWNTSLLELRPGITQVVPDHPQFAYVVRELPGQAGAAQLACRIYRIEVYKTRTDRQRLAPVTTADFLMADADAP